MGISKHCSMQGTATCNKQMQRIETPDPFNDVQACMSRPHLTKAGDAHTHQSQFARLQTPSCGTMPSAKWSFLSQCDQQCPPVNTTDAADVEVCDVANHSTHKSSPPSPLIEALAITYARLKLSCFQKQHTMTRAATTTQQQSVCIAVSQHIAVPSADC